MKKSVLLIFILLLFSTIFNEEYLSILDKEKTIIITQTDEIYELGFQNIIANSETVIFKNENLNRDEDYRFYYKKGEIKFLKKFPSQTKIQIKFKVFPKNLQLSFSKFQKQKVSRKNGIPVVKKKSEEPDYSSSNLNISGSKSFSISAGNQEDMDFDQSLYLQIDGELSDNIFIKAQLSDNNSPIAPEGSTKKISELDKILIKIYSGNYALSFGDFFCKFDDTYFANYEYKLEGVNFHWEAKNDFDFSAAISNGEFISHKFYGIEGKQGPYYLPGKNVANVKVLAGTEKIYLNGNLLTRGNDYIIDYNDGSITFKNANVITDDSHIIADYEYSAEDFRSNLYLSSGNLSFFDNNAKLFFKILSDNDDKEMPLNYSFSDEEKEILKSAGDDQTKARVSGVDSVGTDRYYTWNDSVEIYEYVGLDSTGNYLGDYRIHFSYVGAGNGSYNKIGYYEFEYVGDENGDYIPERQLPLPEKNLNLDFGAELNLGKFLLYSEGIVTYYDKNSFSPIDDNDNQGFALYNKLKFKSDIADFGRTDNSFFYEYKNRYFHPLARTETAKTEYESSDFIDSDTVKITQIHYGGNVGLRVKNWAKNRIEFSEKNLILLAKQNFFSNRFSYFQNKFFPYLPSINYNYSERNETQEDSTANEIEQIINDLNCNYKYDFLDISAGFYEREISHSISSNDRINKNFCKTDFDFGKVKISLEYEVENQDSLGSASDWEKIKRADLWKGNFYFGNEKFDLKTEYSHRENRYFNKTPNSKFDLLDTQISMNFLNKSIYNKINYRIDNLDVYEKVKELVEVGEGDGFYDSFGVEQEDGDYDYKITRLGDAQPVTELQLNWQMNLNPARKFQSINSKFTKILSKFSFSSDISIHEKSKTPHKLDLYLLKSSAFMNENTDYGYQKFREQIWYNIRKNKIVTRLLYEKTKKMDRQYFDENLNIIFDKLWQDDWELSLNFYNVKKWNFENDLSYQKKKSNYQTEDFLNSENYRISTEIGYKFNYNLLLSSEIAYDFEKGKVEDGSNEYTIYSYQVEPQIRYNVGNKYHLLAEFHFQKNDKEGYFADNFASKRDGIITRTTLQFDYKFSKYVTGFLRFHSEKYPESDARHQFRMEVRADF